MYIKFNIITWNISSIKMIRTELIIFYLEQDLLQSRARDQNPVLRSEDHGLISLGVSLDRNSRIDSILTERGHYLF